MAQVYAIMYSKIAFLYILFYIHIDILHLYAILMV